ncbi:MAG: hypothetical protein P8Y74_17870, partial [Desulfobacterales bacterium]
DEGHIGKKGTDGRISAAADQDPVTTEQKPPLRPDRIGRWMKCGSEGHHWLSAGLMVGFDAPFGLPRKWNLARPDVAYIIFQHHMINCAAGCCASVSYGAKHGAMWV